MHAEGQMMTYDVGALALEKPRFEMIIDKIGTS